jgi:hypothetical protein
MRDHFWRQIGGDGMYYPTGGGGMVYPLGSNWDSCSSDGDSPCGNPGNYGACSPGTASPVPTPLFPFFCTSGPLPSPLPIACTPENYNSP